MKAVVDRPTADRELASGIGTRPGEARDEVHRFGGGLTIVISRAGGARHPHVFPSFGRSHLVPYVSPIKVSRLGRECVTGALVFGNQVLLGAIPMEDMDLIVEPSRQIGHRQPGEPEHPLVVGQGYG